MNGKNIHLEYGDVSQVNVAPGEDGNLHLHIYDGDLEESLVTAILTSDEINRLIAALRAGLQPARCTPIPGDPAELEGQLSRLVEAYIWEAAHLDEQGHNCPKAPNQPLFATVAEWGDYKRALEQFQDAQTAWAAENRAALERLEALSNQIGDLMPDSFNLLIPVFGELYRVWATHAWADVANGSQKYRLEVTPHRPNEAKVAVR